MDLSVLSDWELVAHEIDTHGAFEVLFERHKDFVYRVARGLAVDASVADDITQNVYLRVYQRRHKWKPKAAFRTLLYRITVNCARELKRERQRVNAVAILENHAEQSSLAREVEPGVNVAEQVDALLRNLSPRQREVVILRFYEGLSVRETARILGCREGTVKAHLHRAVASLRQQLE